MYTLFYKQGACSLAVHVLLNELGQAFELKSIYAENGKDKNPELLAINPRANVPTLIDEDHDFFMREGGAILTYLCDTHESSLMPNSGEARAKALQWLMFANATLHPAYSKLFGLRGKYSELNIEDASKHALEADAVKAIQGLWDMIEEELNSKSGEYLCGEAMTVGDILVTVIANWNAFAKIDITLGDATKKLLRNVSGMDSYQQAMEAEGISYKVAA